MYNFQKGKYSNEKFLSVIGASLILSIGSGTIMASACVNTAGPQGPHHINKTITLRKLGILFGETDLLTKEQIL